MSNLIQAYAEQPTDQSTISITDQPVLTPQKYMIYAQFNPALFDIFHPFAQGSGPLNERTLPESVRMAWFMEVMRNHDEFLAKAILQGDTSLAASNELSRFDGLLKLLAAEAAVQKVSTPVALTSANIVSEMRRGWDLLPAHIKKHPDLQIIVSANDGEKLNYAAQDQTYKGVDFTTITRNADGAFRFNSKRVWDLVGCPDNHIIYAVMTDNPLTSSLHFGVDWQYDTNNPVTQLGKIRPDWDTWFFKVLLKAATQITRPSEIVLYDGP